MIRVLLADSHKLMHPGIRSILSTSNNITLIGIVDCKQGLDSSLWELQPDALILSLNVIDCPSADYLHHLQNMCPKIRTLALLDSLDEICPQQLLDMGFDGCILKNDSPDKLVEAIEVIVTGQRWCSSLLMPQMVQLQNGRQKELTEREIQVLQAVASEKSDKEIAVMLDISARTVRYHLERSHDKLGTTTRVGAVVEAVRRKLIL